MLPKELLVITCMDERIPVAHALNVKPGEAHFFRNPGALITADAIRTAMLACHLSGVKEIAVLGHTHCGMSLADGPAIKQKIEQFLQAKNLTLNTIQYDPHVPTLQLEDPKKNFTQWIGAFDNIEKQVAQSVAYLQNHPLIPDDVVVRGYVWDIDTKELKNVI